MHVSYTVMGTLWTLKSSHSGLSLYSKDSLAYGTAYYAISLGVNVVLTALIVARFLMYRRTHLAHLPAEHTLQYLSLASFIVESAALYSVFAAAFLVSYALNKPINQVWLGFAQAAQVGTLHVPDWNKLDVCVYVSLTSRMYTCVSPIDANEPMHTNRQQQVATYLIIYRVVDGKAWTRMTIDSAVLTSMNFSTQKSSEANRRHGSQWRRDRAAAASVELTRDSSLGEFNAVESDPDRVESGELTKTRTCEV